MISRFVSLCLPSTGSCFVMISRFVSLLLDPVSSVVSPCLPSTGSCFIMISSSLIWMLVSLWFPSKFLVQGSIFIMVVRRVLLCFPLCIFGRGMIGSQNSQACENVRKAVWGRCWCNSCFLVWWWNFWHCNLRNFAAYLFLFPFQGRLGCEGMHSQSGQSVLSLARHILTCRNSSASPRVCSEDGNCIQYTSKSQNHQRGLMKHPKPLAVFSKCHFSGYILVV